MNSLKVMVDEFVKVGSIFFIYANVASLLSSLWMKAKYNTAVTGCRFEKYANAWFRKVD